MTALVVLLAAALALLGLGVGRFNRRSSRLAALACLAGLVASLAASPSALGAWPVVSVDALSAPLLAALFLLGACGAAPAWVTGALALALLAGDAVLLLAATAAAIARPGDRTGAHPGAHPGARNMALSLAAVGGALLALSWHGALPSPNFAAIRAAPLAALPGAIVLLGTIAAALTLPRCLSPLPAALGALYLLARLLLDLAGPVTPGWWGVPVLAIGALCAPVFARRAAAATELPDAIAQAIAATLALAAAALGAALLARGADLPALAATAVLAAMLLAITGSVWGGLLLLVSVTMVGTAGSPALARLGGLLRRAPVPGLSLLIGLLSMASVPLTPGFAATWLMLQALLATGRAGGTVILALVAGAVAAAGLTFAWLAAASLRLAGAALLGRPRAALTHDEPGRASRLALCTLALATLLLGLIPGLAAAFVQPAVRLLAGAPAQGIGWTAIAAGADVPGYPSPALGLAVVLVAGLVAWAAGAGRPATRHIAPPAAAPWHGGLATPPPDAIPVPLSPRFVLHHGPLTISALVLSALALALAAALGWAAR